MHSNFGHQPDLKAGSRPELRDGGPRVARTAETYSGISVSRRPSVARYRRLVESACLKYSWHDYPPEGWQPIGEWLWNTRVVCEVPNYLASFFPRYLVWPC
jgi:hypothetical protein